VFEKPLEMLVSFAFTKKTERINFDMP